MTGDARAGRARTGRAQNGGDARSSRQRQWDQHYAEAHGGLFGDAPNEYLRMIANRSDFAPETALFLADGDGRNSAWLAGRGVATTALDYSAVATERAEQRDRAAGVAVRRLCADLERWMPGEAETWQAVFILYLNGPETLRRRAVEVAVRALAPGGWLVLESFSVEQPDRPAGILWSLDALSGWLPGFRAVEALSGTVFLNEGIRHYGPTQIVRYAGRKPD